MDKLDYFKKELMKILDKKISEEKANVRKSLAFQIDAIIEKSGSYPVGTIRTWNGKKYIKTATKKWHRKYEKEERGIKMSIFALKKKIDKCENEKELMSLVMCHRDRFTDESGRPLPIVQEFSAYVRAHGNKLESGKTEETPSNDTSGKMSVFGEKFTGVRGKDAIEKLLKEKKGYVENAFSKDGIGSIDVVYGKVTDAKKHKGYGLAHILEKHPEIDSEKITEIVSNGETKKTRNGYNIEYDGYIVGINKGFKKNGEFVTTDNWIVTSFKKNRRKDTDTTASVVGSTPETTGSSNLSSNSIIAENIENVKNFRRKLFSAPHKKEIEYILHLVENARETGEIPKSKWEEIPISENSELRIHAWNLDYNNPSFVIPQTGTYTSMADIKNNTELYKEVKDRLDNSEKTYKENAEKYPDEFFFKKTLKRIRDGKSCLKYLEQFKDNPSGFWGELGDMLDASVKKSLTQFYFKKDENGNMRFFIRKSALRALET